MFLPAMTKPSLSLACCIFLQRHVGRSILLACLLAPFVPEMKCVYHIPVMGFLLSEGRCGRLVPKQRAHDRQAMTFPGAKCAKFAISQK